MVRGFYVQNFGCRATQADGAALERQLAEHGLEPSSTPTSAEVVVLNTCTVTASADQDARAAIRRLHRLNPSARIIVTGCYAQRAPHEIAALPGVAQVIGNSHKHELARIALADQPQIATGSPLPTENAHPTSDSGSTTDDRRLTTALQPTTDDRQPRTGLQPTTAFQPTTDDRRPTTGFRAERETCFPQTPHPNALVPLASLTNPKPPTGFQPTTDDRRQIFVSNIFAHTDFISAPVFDAANERTRPNLKVQDGCDNRCSFCVIPFVRGHSRSLPLERVIEEVNTLVAAGYRELVISGINLGRWGSDLRDSAGPTTDRRATTGVLPTTAHQRPTAAVPPTTDDRRLTTAFEHLLRAILDRTRLEKLRISSVEPMDWTDELISLVAHSPRIARHAHVPMQSGSDAVLRRMHRRYRPWHYREKIEKIHAAMPTAAIGADVMVGFPGETDAEFEDTRRMVEELPFTYLHVFTYSPRPGTPAAQMKKQVATQVARERNRILRDLAAQKKLSFMRSFVGKTLEAITLNQCGAATLARHGCDTDTPRSFTEALTDNYLKLRLAGHHEPNRWLRVKIEGLESDSLIGTPLA
jgi:threonylcarbamoyladenosine tRNA methylthiotransferase MtaB